MKSTIIGGFALTAMFAFAGSANAATCAAGTLDTDPAAPVGPNPLATLTNSNYCGPGTSGKGQDNDTAALVRYVENVSGFDLLWSEIDKDEAAGSGTSGILRSTGTNPAGSSGDWGIDTSLITGGLNRFLIVIKDGNDVTPAWYWFIVDTGAGCAASGNAFSGLSYCGTWSMYGKDGSIKNISHLTLYGARSDVPDQPLPEPGTLALFGLGLVGLGMSRRRRG